MMWNLFGIMIWAAGSAPSGQCLLKQTCIVFCRKCSNADRITYKIIKVKLITYKTSNKIILLLLLLLLVSDIFD